MTKAALKTKLKNAIGKVEDEDVLQALYSIVYTHLHSEVEIPEEHKKMLDERLARDNAGLEKSYSWEEVKKKVRNRTKIR